MTQHEHRLFLYLLKALADESRLRMIGLLDSEERNVRDLASLLGLREPTVSHHLAKMRAVGLINLRTDGNQHFYRLNRQRLEELKALMADIEKLTWGVPESDNTWIDALPLEESDRKVLHDCTFNGRLKRIPAKRGKLLVVLRWLASRFQATVEYSEAEVNAILQQVHDDYLTLRRDLVDFGFLKRERDGSRYWLAPER